jgi:hypothetical protein
LRILDLHKHDKSESNLIVNKMNKTTTTTTTTTTTQHNTTQHNNKPYFEMMSVLIDCPQNTKLAGDCPKMML